MSISRGTLQKALLLNKRIYGCVSFIFIILLILPAFRIPAQEVSVLQSGPIYRKGIPFFPPNAIPAFYGIYTFNDAEVTVYYTEKRIPRSEEWEEFVCLGNRGLLLPEQTGTVMVYPPVQDDDWTLFIAYNGEREDFCRFVDTFIRRFQYFYGISRDKSIPPFPAVLPFE